MFLNTRSASPGSRKSKTDTMSNPLKAECIVRVKEEDPEKQRQRQELVKTKTPKELGKITSLSDIPVPSPIENLMKKR